MSRIESRLDKLEKRNGGSGSDRTNREAYLDAVSRVEIASIIGLGFELQDFLHEEFEDYDDGDFADDEDTIERYESSLVDKGLMSATDRRVAHRRGRENRLSGMIIQCEEGGAERLFHEPSAR